MFELSWTVRDLFYVLIPILSDRGSRLSEGFILDYFIAVIWSNLESLYIGWFTYPIKEAFIKWYSITVLYILCNITFSTFGSLASTFWSFSVTPWVSSNSHDFKRGSHSHDCRGDHRRPKQSPVVAWMSAVKSAKVEFYNRSTTESTTTDVDTRPSYDIVVRSL